MLAMKKKTLQIIASQMNKTIITYVNALIACIDLDIIIGHAWMQNAVISCVCVQHNVLGLNKFEVP